MKKILIITILGLLILLILSISAVSAKTNFYDDFYNDLLDNIYNGFHRVAAGEIIVKFKTGTEENVISEINSRYGSYTVHRYDSAGFHRIKIPNGKTVTEMVEKYKMNPNVEYVEPNYIAHTCMMPNDEYYNYQWHLHNLDDGGINMEPAWDISTGSGVIVAVLDTGISVGTDLANTCFVNGYDFVNNDNNPTDDYGHGTHIAGTIAQSTNNDIGLAGVAYDACLMPVKVLDSYGYGTYSDIADGIYFAADHGADIISMSLGGNSGSQALKDACQYAYNKGVTLIASAGNNGVSSIKYPAAYDDYVIAVGATQYDKTKTWYSNYGSSLDLVAPGGNLDLDQNDDGYPDGILQQTFEMMWRRADWGYYFKEGTSMAAPHVTGVAALVIANGNADVNGDGTTSPNEVRAALEETAEDLGSSGWDQTYGWGLVNAYAALQWSTTPNNPPVAHDQTINTQEDTSKPITLTATDPDGDSLTYSIQNNPTHGTITGTPPSITYIPNTNYYGTDSFTFKVNDGKTNSNSATITITIASVNDVPIANGQSRSTNQDTSVDITLTASDIENDPLTFNILSGPSHGTISGTPPYITYTPNTGYIGQDSFTFKVNDGKTDSNIATVNIMVTEVNIPPVADDQTINTQEDTSKPITLTAADLNGDTLTYSIVDYPLHGILSGIAPSITYIPNSNYFGSDSLTFKANDGEVDSNTATITITIISVNDAPIANDQSASTNQNTAIAITLTASDTEDDALTYLIISGPSHGTLSGITPSITYTPDTGYTGSDSFTFEANDGELNSNTATVIITVNPAIDFNMHIYNIEMSEETFTYRWWTRTRAIATITVVDSNNNPVEGAKVSGMWSGLTYSYVFDTTNSQGQIKIYSMWRWNAWGIFAITVQDVEKSEWTYDESLNVETSDSITV